MDQNRILRQELDLARRNGFATVKGELQEAFSAVRAAITDHNGLGIATLSIGGPKNRLSKSALRTIGAALRKEARKLESSSVVLIG